MPADKRPSAPARPPFNLVTYAERRASPYSFRGRANYPEVLSDASLFLVADSWGHKVQRLARGKSCSFSGGSPLAPHNNSKKDEAFIHESISYEKLVKVIRNLAADSIHAK